MRLFGPPSAPQKQVLDKLMVMGGHSRFVQEMFPWLWEAGLETFVDPVGLVAQSWKETKGGQFTGNVRPYFCNTAGIKVRDTKSTMELLGTTNEDHPLVHSQFASWEVGALAHAQHVRAYGGWPYLGLIVDPRYSLALRQPGNPARPVLEHWEQFSVNWAPSPTYGRELEAIMSQLRTA
jgi:hypothetical protein